jgi:hypothetical protein
MRLAPLSAIIFTATTGLAVSATEAATIGYDFDAQNGSPTQTDPSVNLSPVNLTGDTTYFNAAGNPGFAAYIFSESNSSFLDFTAAPVSSASFSTFAFDTKSIFSTTSIQVFSSLDGFTTALYTYTVTSTETFIQNSFALPVAFTNLSSPVTFRIEDSGSSSFDNIQLNVVSVPFEVSPTFGLAVLGGLWAGRKLLKQAKQARDQV